VQVASILNPLRASVGLFLRFAHPACPIHHVKIHVPFRIRITSFSLYSLRHAAVVWRQPAKFSNRGLSRTLMGFCQDRVHGAFNAACAGELIQTVKEP
jgi:hypothetical protein